MKYNIVILVSAFTIGFPSFGCGQDIEGQKPPSDSSQTFRLRNEGKPLSRQILRAELIAFGFQSSTTGFLMLMPQDYTNWSFVGAGARFGDAFTKAPVLDDDNWLFNYLIHPLSGCLMYNTMRSQGAKIVPSFLFATSQSLIWEFLMESWLEQPSIQDLLVTSNIGSLMGEGVHQLTLRMGRNGFRTSEKVIVILTNPSFWLNNGFRRKPISE